VAEVTTDNLLLFNRPSFWSQATAASFDQACRHDGGTEVWGPIFPRLFVKYTVKHGRLKHTVRAVATFEATEAVVFRTVASVKQHYFDHFQRTWVSSRSLYAIACPSVVCNVRAPYSDGSNFRHYFYGISYTGHPLMVTENFTEIVPGEPLRRGS